MAIFRTNSKQVRMKQRLISYASIFHRNDTFYHHSDESKGTRCGGSTEEITVRFG